MYQIRRYRFLLFLLQSCMVLLLLACVSSDTTKTTTVPMPPTQVNCPKKDTFRPAIMAPLALGDHPNVVYVINESVTKGNNVVYNAILQRYDTSVSKTTIIFKSSNMQIGNAQVSPDGTWLLFWVSLDPNDNVSGAETAELRMIRMDGQGLQTLYCDSQEASISGSVIWSPNGDLLAFAIGNAVFGNDDPTYVDLLDLATGVLRPLLTPQPSLSSLTNPMAIVYLPSEWLSETEIYMKPIQLSAPLPSLYALDTKEGWNQPPDNLLPIVKLSEQFCMSYGLSPTRTNLFVAVCHNNADDTGFTDFPPSMLVKETPFGGAQTPVYTASTLTVTDVQVVNDSTLLLLVLNPVCDQLGNCRGSDKDSGIWKMNTDGSHLTYFLPGFIGGHYLNSNWVNISLDGTMYALDLEGNSSDNLIYGSIDGGNPTTIVSTVHSYSGFSPDYQLSIIGWTSL